MPVTHASYQLSAVDAKRNAIDATNLKTFAHATDAEINDQKFTKFNLNVNKYLLS